MCFCMVDICSRCGEIFYVFNGINIDWVIFEFSFLVNGKDVVLKKFKNCIE